MRLREARGIVVVVVRERGKDEESAQMEEDCLWYCRIKVRESVPTRGQTLPAKESIGDNYVHKVSFVIITVEYGEGRKRKEGWKGGRKEEWRREG